MKTLQIIQRLSKIAKIVCVIIFICSLVGAIGCLVGAVVLAAIPEGFRIDDMTIHAYLEKNANTNIGTCITVLIKGFFLCASSAVLSKIAEHYFKNELAAGTPFTFEGAKELLRLGIITVGVSVGVSFMAEIICAAISMFFDDIKSVSISGTVSTGLGLAFIVMSLLCKHGAEVVQMKGFSQREN